MTMTAPGPFTLFRDQIRQTYGNRCAICLTLLPEVGIQSAHLIDSQAAALGGVQLATAVDIGLLTEDYQRSSSANGLAQCPSCHLSYFTPDFVALSPSLPVLRYIRNYLDTPRANRRSLHEVFKLLRRAMAGHAVTLPDPTSILPFLGLFTIVILKPEGLLGCRIPTLHLPPLSILQDNHFAFAPAGTLPGDENVARIFDVLGMIGLDPVPESCGMIPLSPEYPEFEQQRYWRLILPPEAILAALMTRITIGTFEGEEIRLAQEIYHTLRLEALAHGPDCGGRSGGGSGGGSGQGHGSSGPGARGGGRDGGGLSGDKFIAHERNPRSRNPRSRNREPPRKKARRTGEGDLGEKGGVKSCPLKTAEPGLSDTSSSPVPRQRVNLDDWEVASSFPTTIGNESVQTKSLFEDSEPMSARPASEDGCDDPAAWRFGPSYGSDMIVVAARGISLV